MIGRIVYVIFAIHIPFLINAQFEFSGYGISGGGAITEFEYGQKVQSVNNFEGKSKGGGTGGIRLDFDLGSEIMKLSPELFVVQNGAREFYTDLQVLQSDLISRKVSLDYIGVFLPLTLYWALDNGSGNTKDNYNGILIQGRFFADYVIGGKIVNGVSAESEIKFNNNSDKLDFGYSIEAGFVMEGLRLSVGYNWGLKNIEFNDALGIGKGEDYLINNKGLTVQIGFLQKIN